MATINLPEYFKLSSWYWNEGCINYDGIILSELSLEDFLKYKTQNLQSDTIYVLSIDTRAMTRFTVLYSLSSIF